MENLCGEKEEEGFDQLIPEESEGGKEQDGFENLLDDQLEMPTVSALDEKSQCSGMPLSERNPSYGANESPTLQEPSIKMAAAYMMRTNSQEQAEERAFEVEESENESEKEEKKNISAKKQQNQERKLVFTSIALISGINLVYLIFPTWVSIPLAIVILGSVLISSLTVLDTEVIEEEESNDQ